VLDAEDSPGLTLDGGKDDGITATAPLVTVSGGTLTMGERVTLQNNKRNGVTSSGSAVSVLSGGKFTMSGGMICGNTGPMHGGGVNVENSRFEMHGGTISGNTAGFAGGVRVSNDANTVFIMTDGTISGNTSSGDCGGVFVGNNGRFEMSGGTISGNMFTGNGGGVFVDEKPDTKFTMSGNAVVKQDVYLSSGKIITVSGALTPPAGECSAEIKLVTPSDNSDVVVFEGDGTSYRLSFGDVSKFKLLCDGKSLLYSNTDNNAKLVSVTPSGPAIQASYSNGGAPIYDSLKTIIENVSGTESVPAVVNIVADVVELASTVSITNGNHITLTVMDDWEVTTIKRKSSFKDSMFSVESGGSLVLDAGNGSLTLDGGKDDNITAEAALVKVDGGTLTMGGNVTLQNNNRSSTDTSSTGGGVYLTNNGTFNMSGGKISSNTARWGGGVYIGGSGIFNMSGGIISGNTASQGGGVYQGGGAFTMSGGSKINGNADSPPNTASTGAAYARSSGTKPPGLESTNNTIIGGVVQLQ
jgi:hypothetical protein